ncbi:hypothetical protein HN803_07075 [candidate division WWE3 bacterium]|jgi:hypothetical protein|nr:hypothetical protein [candidate division WWE3 bacterium]
MMKLTEAFDAPKRKWVVKKLSDLDQDVLDEIWDMYEHTYKAIGLVVSNMSQMMGKYKISLLIDVDKDPLPDAFTIYKPTKFGAKMVLSGTDGSKEGKSALVKHKLQSLKKRGWYIEASHRMADILLSNGINVVDKQEDVEKVIGKKVKWLDDDGQYERAVGGGSINATKRLFGNPKI